MAQNHFDYFTSRADEEDRLAEFAIHRSVKATHMKFAAAYRAEAGPTRPIIGEAAQPTETIPAD